MAKKKPAANQEQPETEVVNVDPVEPVEAAAVDAPAPAEADAPAPAEADVPAPAEADAPAATMTGLRVTARAEGFRRAGLAFGRLPAEIPLDALEPWQIEALKAEPMLQVEEIEL